uniref:NADH-ubiquinone oxidoreductase chain 3 n=1 Tax=Curculionoidea sp. 19 KM-2017 TaxID=2219402 RepID=A0A346RIN9_9CUCU|nr:NADH dehydrogenase subunit 3 [Curculionoidea sp. 19 KM-2017]
MKTMMLFFTIITIIIIIITLILNFLSKKTFYDREKNSPFECGFDPKNFARLPFSLHFFLIALIFVIFDVELTLLLPMILIIKYTSILKFSLVMNFFIMILLLGLFHEKAQGSLNWMN